MNDTNTPDVIIRGKAIKFHPFDTELGNTFDFAASELALNHKGKLSQRQRIHLAGKRENAVIMWFGGGLFLLLLLFVSYPDISQAQIGIQVIFGVLPIWMLIIGVVTWRKRSQEIEGELVAIIAGELTFSSRGEYMLQVGHLVWVMKPKQYHRLEKFYHKYDTVPNIAVYYMAHSEALLSMV